MLQCLATGYAQASQAFPLTGEYGLLAQLDLLLASLRQDASGVDGRVQLHVEEHLAAHLALPGQPLDEEVCAQAGRDLLHLAALTLSVPVFADLSAGYGLGRPDQVTLYRDDHLHLRGGQTYLTLRGDMGLRVEGQIQVQYDPQDPVDAVPLTPPLPYTLTVGPGGPNIGVWRHRSRLRRSAGHHPRLRAGGTPRGGV